MSIWPIPKPEPSSADSFPLDKNKNAQGGRAAKGSPMNKPAATVSPVPSSMAPLLQKLIQQYATTGLPPAYLPQTSQPCNPDL
jgi:putative transposase